MKEDICRVRVSTARPGEGFLPVNMALCLKKITRVKPANQLPIKK